jgi:hypothetical protein
MSSADDASVPVEARRLVEGFVGEWTANGTMIADGKRAAIAGAWRFARAADGWGVVGELKTEIEGWGAIEETELAGYDAAEGKVHLIGMNKFVVRDHVGDWLDATTLQVVYRGQQAGREVIEEVTIDFSTPGVQRGRVLEKVDGVVTIVTELVLTRRAPIGALHARSPVDRSPST